MKINVTVDLKDFYTEEEGQSFSEEIKLYISNKVKSMVWKDFEIKALEDVKQRIEIEFKKSKEMNVDKIVKNIFSTKEIKKSDRGGNEMITLEKYIIEKLESDYFSSNKNAESVLSNYIRSFENKFSDELNKTSNQIGKELKDRYDLLFASQLVSKLNEAGMLKGDVANLLLPKEG